MDVRTAASPTTTPTGPTTDPTTAGPDAGAPQHGPPPPPPASRPTGGGRSGLPLRSYVAVAAIAALSAGAVVLPTQLADTPTAAVATDAPADALVDAAPLATDGELVAAVANRLTPSVVRIDVAGPAGGGSGSGVVIDADGHVLTNAHVVDGAADVSVTTPDGQRLDAQIVGADPGSDVAVLRVDAALPVPTFATDEPTVGQTAVAIGSPFGLDGSVTSGVVSAAGRTIPGDGAPLVDMLQTDAAINPGNSGGALADAAGRVIGINTAILSRSGTNGGIGFAIPIATALDVADQLITTGEVRAGYLGIEGQTVDPQVAQLYGLDMSQGAIVAAVVDGSPADVAGLQEGDVIVALDGAETPSMLDLAGRIRRVAPDVPITLTVVRDGEALELQVVLTERPDQLG